MNRKTYKYLWYNEYSNINFYYNTIIGGIKDEK